MESIHFLTIYPYLILNPVLKKYKNINRFVKILFYDTFQKPHSGQTSVYFNKKKERRWFLPGISFPGRLKNILLAQFDFPVWLFHLKDSLIRIDFTIEINKPDIYIRTVYDLFIKN